MATITKRGDLQWQAKVRRKGHPAQSKTFDSRADAEKWARHTENSMDRGIFVSRAEAERMTLREALDIYEKEVTPAKKGSVQETHRINKWRRHKLACSSLAALRAKDFAEHRDARLSEGAAPATVRLELAVVSHLFNTVSKEWGIYVENPIRNIRMPRVKNDRDRRLIEDEEARLLKALTSPAGERSNSEVKPVVVLALETAMRQGELLSLRWEHVDLRRQVAHLPDTKNGTSRDVPLSSRAVEVLRALPRNISGNVFSSTESALKQSWVRAVRRARKEYEEECRTAGMEQNPRLLVNLHFHDLRHEATSRLAEKLALHELMKVTGHKDTRMLARYYHPRAEDLARKLG